MENHSLQPIRTVWYTVDDAEKKLGCTRKQISKWIAAGWLRAFKNDQDKPVFRRNDLLEAQDRQFDAELPAKQEKIRSDPSMG